MNRFHDWYCGSKYWRRAIEERVAWTLGGVDLGDAVLELGPGPGLTTDILLRKYSKLTAVEIDAGHARRLGERLDASRCTVHNGDATALSFPDGSFSGVTAMTMLHHLPTEALQDKLFSEAFRVLKPGGVFAASDSKWSLAMALIHLFDTLNAMKPSGLTGRLEAVGFHEIEIAEAGHAFRFRARRPA